MNSSSQTFPDDFVWGVSSAAYQIEGAWDQDEKGESIWDHFSHTPGKIENGDTGDVACDHYHRYREDIGLMERLGIRAYRFSISWPRLLPRGRGPLNRAGLDFYDRLIDGLLEAKIQPYLTLFHWDLPQAMQDRGGWQNRDTGRYFADYAALVAEHLGDRVRYWMTMNEPQVLAYLGHYKGEHAPGLRDERMAIQVSHNLLVAHGLAVQAVRANNGGGEVGIALDIHPFEPAGDKAADIDAAELGWQTTSGWYLEPIFAGHYPSAALDFYSDKVPEIQSGDMELISQKLDFLGINFYARQVVGPDGPVRVPDAEYTEMGWEVHAPALRKLLVDMNREYQLPPIFITENGAAFADTLGADGHVHDTRRIDFLSEHIAQARLAMDDGVKLRGYFVWSLLDNFEWSYGYSKRFGLIYVDYATQRRIIKDSGEWYARVIGRKMVE